MVAGQVQRGDTFRNRTTRDDGRLGATIRRVPLAELPIEVAQALAHIRAGAPFPYPQDGYVFFNRENRLPRRSADHYREYTVETPGSQDRGARRLIVGGASAEVYYTDDHYETFCQVVEVNG
jgi:ribonuclease T1